MKTNILLFLLALSYSSICQAQSSISLVKYRSGKKIVIPAGELITIKTTNSIKLKGEFLEIRDTNIIIAHDSTYDTCPLNKIDWLKYKHKSYGNSFLQGSAQAIVTAAPIYVIFGLANNYLADIDPVFQERNFKTAGLIAMTGITLYYVTELLINKKHRVNYWKIIPLNFNEI